MREITFLAPCNMDIDILELRQKENQENELKIGFVPTSGSLIVPMGGMISDIKPLGFDYTLVAHKDISMHLIVGQGSSKAFGFGFDIKVVIGQAVSEGDRLLGLDIEQLKSSIDSLHSSIDLNTVHQIKLLVNQNAPLTIKQGESICQVIIN